MFNFIQQQALFLPYLPSKAKPTLVGMNTEVTLRKSNIIWTAVDSLLFIRNFNKGQRKKAAVQQRASPALAQLLHKMRKFQNEKVNITLYSREEGRDVSSQSLEIANLTLMKCKHPPTPWIRSTCDSFLVELLCPHYPQGKKLQTPSSSKPGLLQWCSCSLFSGLAGQAQSSQTDSANRSQLGVLQFGKTHRGKLCLH